MAFDDTCNSNDVVNDLYHYFFSFSIYDPKIDGNQCDNGSKKGNFVESEVRLMLQFCADPILVVFGQKKRINS